jgi:hypothetical protein
VRALALQKNPRCAGLAANSSKSEASSLFQPIPENTTQGINQIGPGEASQPIDE